MDVKYNEFSKQVLNQLPRGAFLSVKAGDKINTMTIGWGAIGYIWKKPIMIVVVRPSRYTFELLEQAGEFSVSIPGESSSLNNSLATAGTKSGRDVNKFNVCNLTAKNGKVIESPIIGECELIYECKVVYKQSIDPDFLDKDICTKFYSDNNFHTIYYGEIVACYHNN